MGSSVHMVGVVLVTALAVGLLDHAMSGPGHERRDAQPDIHTTAADLQLVYGPPRTIEFEEHEMWIDLNGNGHAERIVLLLDERRGRRTPWPENADEWRGEVVDGFAVFDGRQPNVPVFYQYRDGGMSLRLDEIEGQRVLVSDGGRDHTQSVWGWWRYAEPWPADGWEARWRPLDDQQQGSLRWRRGSPILVSVGK